MKKTLAVGHFLNADFQSACARHLGRIRETFFAWPGVLSCRPAPDFTPEVRERMVSDLKWARANGILLDTLFNCSVKVKEQYRILFNVPITSRCCNAGNNRNSHNRENQACNYHTQYAGECDFKKLFHNSLF